MTLGEKISIALVKYKAYYVLQLSKYKQLLEDGDMINSETQLWYSQYLEFYIYSLDYIYKWIETDGSLNPDAPINETDINSLIDKANELLHILFETPLNP